MKVKLNLSHLQKALKNISKSVPSNPQLPILSSILFEFKKNELILSATDLYLGVRTTLDIKNEEKISVAIPGQMFRDIVNSLNSEEITLEIGEKEVGIISGAGKTRLPISTADDYPDFPQIEGDELVLSAEIIQEINSLVSFAASRDQVRPILTTVMFEFSGKGLEVVATDGFRLSIIKYPEFKLNTKHKILIPIKAFEEMYRIMEQVSAKEILIQVSEELKQIRAKTDGYEMFIRLVEGDYPPYEKIVPENFQIKFGVGGEELEQELYKASIIARKASNIVKIKLSEKSLTISSATNSFGEYSGEIVLSQSESVEEEIEVAFDIRYLQDFFSSVKPELVQICVNESLKPVAFNLPGQDNFTYIVMPFRVND